MTTYKHIVNAPDCPCVACKWSRQDMAANARVLETINRRYNRREPGPWAHVAAGIGYLLLFAVCLALLFVALLAGAPLTLGKP